MLTEAIKGKAAPIALSESLDASAGELVRVAKEFGFEGIVAKRKDSLYESGKRTGKWVKYKVNSWLMRFHGSGLSGTRGLVLCATVET